MKPGPYIIRFEVDVVRGRQYTTVSQSLEAEEVSLSIQSESVYARA
jgi:hypothetical protein